MTSAEFKLGVFEIGGNEALEYYKSEWKAENIQCSRFTEELLEKFAEDFRIAQYESERRRPTYEDED